MFQSPSHKAWPKQKVIANINENAGTKFDPNVINTFTELMKE
jgi:HD-GYP domain-containing protein (c-di-GMP phosphodiesterase class II)